MREAKSAATASVNGDVIEARSQHGPTKAERGRQLTRPEELGEEDPSLAARGGGVSLALPLGQRRWHSPSLNRRSVPRELEKE